MPITPGSPLQNTLATYLAEVRRLLRDNNGSLYTDPDLTQFINRAIRTRDLDTGINRLRMSFNLTTGVFDYTFSAIIAGGTVLDGVQGAVPQDVLSLVVMPLGGANSSMRYPMGRWPYSKLAFLLSNQMPSYPVVYAVYGSGNIMLGPPPAQNYPVEIDFVCYSSPLANNTDTDPMPYPYTEPVCYLAAALAKTQAQRFDEAQGFKGMYDDSLRRVKARAKPMMISNPWTDLPRR